MENFSCSEGRPPDEGVPDVLMVDDVAGEDGTDPNAVGEQCGVLEECVGTGAGDMSADHVDIETCDQLMAEMGGPVIKTETEPPIKSEQEEESELEEEKEPLSYDLAQGNRILTEIMSDANKSLNWPFMDPVDTEGMGLADYHDRVREPMWLRKIREKFDKRMYTTITEFARDFRLMLENCYRYNGPDHYVSKRGQKLDTVFEQKLGLLSRDLREKTSIAATSGKPIEDKIITGTRRRKVLTPHDSSDLLNKLRQEEKDRERENRKLQVEERRQQQQAAVQELIDWEDELLGPGGREYLYAMWELPQIGHFLFLTADVLNIGEVMQWEIERSFWMPRQSPVLQIIMTSLLSTPYQRTKLESKPPMPYKLWEDKLRTRVRNWYKIFNENNRDTKKTHMKIGLEEKFFKVVGITNPLERKLFHELTFYQRVWIVKSLCDWCLATQESIRETIETQPLVEQRHYDLGTDAEGNSYIHFPQFCGQDLRVYRVAPIEMPKTDRPKVKKEEKQKSPTKRKGAARRGRQTAPTPSTKQRQSSRLRAPSSHSESSGSSSDSGINESEGSDLEAPITKSRRKSPAGSSSKPSSVTNTPTKGRSSRTSAAARDWTPRDASLLSELTGRRGSRSQRLTCALVDNSGTSTPTTIATPSGSRASTPVHTKDPSSRSSTPSLDASSSRASSPSKLPASSSCLRKRRTKGSCKTKKQAVESDQSDDEETSMDVVDKAVNNDDNVNSATQDDSVTDSNAAPTITNQDGESKREGLCVNGFLPGEEEGDSRIGTPFSSYSAEDSLLCGVPGTSDAKTTCDIDSKLACTQQPTRPVHGAACLPDNGNSPVESRANGQCEGATKLLSRGGSLKGSSFDGDNCENQFCLCKCDGLKEGAVDCPSLNQTKSHLEGKGTTSADGNHVYSESDMPLLTNDMVNMPNVDTHADPVLPIKIEPETDMPVIDGPELYESQSDLNDILMPELEPMSMEPMDIKPTLPELTDVKMALCEQDIKQEPGNALVAETVINGEQTSGSVVKQEEEEHVEPEIKYPEVGPFRLIADSVDLLKELSLQFAEPEPIIEIKGKKEKILRPPPRKRCVSDLYDRLVYLLKELEPWESKLLAVNKKARIKLRKEVENYVEENEAEEVEDVWESEESQSEDSDENEDSEDEAEEEIVEELVKEVKKEPVATVTASPTKSVPKSAKKTIVLIPPPDTDASTSNDSTNFSNDPEKSSFGRVRKRKVIPNAYDEPPPVIKKKKEREHSPSPTPNILASSRSKNKAATQEPNSIDSLRTALSKAKPVATPSALPPGMQLLNIGGQNVLLNTNTNPPVILQTSAPLNLNNLTLLAQLSAKAAAGNSLSSKRVVSSTSSIRTAVATSRPAQATSAPLNSPPPQQVIRTLLAAGHAPQHPKARIIQPAVTPMTKSTPLTPSSAVQQLQFVQSAVSTGTSSVTTLASSLPPGSVATQVSGQSLLQHNSAAGDNTRPQFYKYNDMSQMKATIRQQLVKTSQGLRTKSTVCTMPTGHTALSNLIQAGLLPQSPRMTSSTVPPGTISQVATATKAAPTVLTVPVKSHNSSESGAAAMSAPIAPTTVVASVEAKPPSILSQVLASTGPAGPQQTVVHTDIPSGTKQLQLKQLQPQAQAPQQQPIPQPQQLKPQTQLQPQKVPQPQQLQQPQQQQQTQHIVAGTSTQSILQSPTSKNTQSTVTILTSPQKSPVGTHILPKGQLSPEFKAAIKMGIVNESNIGSLIHANPGLAKALNNTMRPKYASNVTVKSLLESRALRQKAQLYGEAETSTIPSAASPPGASLTVSPQKATASPIKVQGLNLPTPNDKPVAIQIHSVNPKPQVVQTPTSAVSPHLVISAKPQQVGKTKTLPLQVQSIKTEDQTQVPPTTVSKTPIQLQAVRTSQGTILHTLSGQQVTVRPAGARLQLGSGGQQMVRLVSPTGAIQLVDTALPATPKQPAQPNTIATSTHTLTSLDEAVKSVITSVSCSIPPTPLSIKRPFSTSGQQSIRQVTTTTNTMKSPIPSVMQMPAAETPLASAVGQTAKVILSPNSKSITSGQVVSGSVGVPSVSGTQKNVVLRVLPGQQQIMTSQGLINMVVPQQLLEQSLTADSATGKLVLQAGKGGLQLTQMAATQSTTSSPTKVSALPSPALPRPAIKQPTAQSNPRTITVFPPGHLRPQTQQTAPNLDVKQTFVTSMQSQALPTEPRSHVQIKLVPQTSGVAQLSQGLAIGAEQQPQPKANHTLVLKRDGSLSIGANPVAQSQTMLVNKAQLQQRQGLPRMTSPVKQVVSAQSNIRVVSPQLTLSSAGLVPARMTQPRMQLSQAAPPAMIQAFQTQPVSRKQEADIKPPPFLLERDGMGEVTSSLDLLAAASMLQEAKAPLPSQIQPQVCNSRGDGSTQLALSGVRIQDTLQASPQSQEVALQSPNVKRELSEHSQVIVSREPAISQTQQPQKTTTPTIPLNKFHQQQAMVLEQQIKLQQQMLEEQQKQQKLIRQLTLQQEVALGAPPTCKPQSQVLLQAAAPSPLPAAKVLVTTPAKTPRTVPDGATVPSSGTATPAGTQMAGVMASAGGRMVQLRFAVPAGMNVQQLLQTSQFQQQLAALKVSAIHGITTSTVTATSSTQSTARTASPVSASLLTSPEQVVVSSRGGQAARHVHGTAVHTPVHARPVQGGSGPVRLVTTTANNAAASVTTPSKPVPTGKTLTLPQGAATVVTGQQPGNKVTVLVNVNGQLVQAQGLSLGSNMRVVSSGGELSTARSAAPKLVATAGGLPVGAKVIQTVNNSLATHSSSQPRFLTAKTTGHPMLTSPTKVVLQPRAMTPQRGTAPHLLVTRTGDGGNTVRLPVGMTLQEAAKSNLLSQLASAGATAGAAPGGLIITKPITASNASPQVTYTTMSTVTPQNANFHNGK